jgi:phosphoribosylglycinamide formyltransferase-1
MSTPVPIVVLASGRGSNLDALVRDLRQREHPGQVVAVLSDRPTALALDVARNHGLPSMTIDFGGFEQREAFDSALTAAVASFEPQWVVLAGFRKLLGAATVRAFQHRILNVHPSLLPSFPGLHAIQDALHHGVRVTGTTVHLVDAGLDTGPIVAQRAVPVCAGDDLASLTARIQAVEHQLLPAVVRAAVEGRLRTDGSRAWVDGPCA